MIFGPKSWKPKSNYAIRNHYICFNFRLFCWGEGKTNPYFLGVRPRIPKTCTSQSYFKTAAQELSALGAAPCCPGCTHPSSSKEGVTPCSLLTKCQFSLRPFPSGTKNSTRPLTWQERGRFSWKKNELPRPENTLSPISPPTQNYPKCNINMLMKNYS